jgi:DNA-binding SARP family transcriptional activator
VDVRFEVLGEFRARVGDVVVDLGAARQRAVLAALVVDAGQTVMLDQLVERVWGEHAPDSVLPTVRSYLSRLRTVLGGATGFGIVRQAGGYVARTDPSTVDLNRFTDLVATARRSTDEARADEAFRQALGLWRDEAFAGLDSPWFAVRRHSLAIARHTVILDHLDLRLRRGGHAEALPELVELAARNPRDERLTAQLMVALYRAGRQAEALEHFERLRVLLAEELGADPGPELARLHEQILRSEVAAVVSTGSVPRQLPVRPWVFAGRVGELDALSGVLDGHGAVVISAIGGVGGIGKTWLALHWAYGRLDSFPDGQLYANLRGFDPRTAPVGPEVVLRGFLEALGVEPAEIPADVDAQASLFRTAVARKRMLIVLDNARDAAQVAPLLPGVGPARVVVTSRNRLISLVSGHGAYPLTLDVLDRDEARAVLVGHLGERRVRTEPDAVDVVLDYCAGLPLALGIVAARALVQSELSLTWLADELRDETARLDAVDTGDEDVNLRAVLSWSHRALSERAKVLFGLLGLVPSADIALAGVASLLGTPLEDTKALLDELEHAHLVARPVAGRYRMHDLVKLYAAEQAPPGREEALTRLVDHYLHTAYAGERLLFPERTDIKFDPAVPGAVVEDLRDLAATTAWFEAEQAAVVAVQSVAGEQAWRLAWAFTTYQVRQNKYADRLALWLGGLSSVERVGDTWALTLAHRSIADSYAHLGRHGEAMHHLEEALVVAEASGDPVTHGNVHYGLAAALEERGDDEGALEHALDALRLYRTGTSKMQLAQGHAAVGWYSAKVGLHEQAREYGEKALELFHGLGSVESEASVLDTLALAAHGTGDHALAIQRYRQALALFREVGASTHEADVLQRLGKVLQDVGDRGEAHAALTRARDLFLKQGRTVQADRVSELL